jgi:t-SNARE complex subunit (syntaxin)
MKTPSVLRTQDEANDKWRKVVNAAKRIQSRGNVQAQSSLERLDNEILRLLTETKQQRHLRKLMEALDEFDKQYRRLRSQLAKYVRRAQAAELRRARERARAMNERARLKKLSHGGKRAVRVRD